MTFNSRLDIPITAIGPQSGAKRDTAELCRERAAADLLASTAMINAHQRARMETSAAVWPQRAEMLQRVEDGIARRAAVDAAVLPIGDEPLAEPIRY